MVFSELKSEQMTNIKIGESTSLHGFSFSINNWMKSNWCCIWWFFSSAQSISLLSGVYSTAADSHGTNHWYVPLYACLQISVVYYLFFMTMTAWLQWCLSIKKLCCFSPRWPVPPWQCVVLVGVHPHLSVQCSLGASSVCSQQDSQCHLVPGQVHGYATLFDDDHPWSFIWLCTLNVKLQYWFCAFVSPHRI